jgi:hypothetical protein
VQAEAVAKGANLGNLGITEATKAAATNVGANVAGNAGGGFMGSMARSLAPAALYAGSQYFAQRGKEEDEKGLAFWGVDLTGDTPVTHSPFDNANEIAAPQFAAAEGAPEFMPPQGAPNGLMDPNNPYNPYNPYG